MKGKNDKYRWLLIGILIVSFLMVIAMTWYFTSQSAEVSDTHSMPIAKYIQNAIADKFVINPTDYFWRYNIDELVRKGAHFIEYILLGSIACMLLYVLFRRVWLAISMSLVGCSIYAYIDEYRQTFFPGRTPRWFDWRVDVSGAVVGIVMATIVVLIVRYIHKLKARIRELEEHHE